VADNIIMKVIDPITGKKPDTDTKSTIIEAYKNIETYNVENQDINNRLKNNNILRFY
jgi:penicillin-binding protein 1A